jgi:hypothetical protein
MTRDVDVEIRERTLTALRALVEPPPPRLQTEAALMLAVDFNDASVIAEAARRRALAEEKLSALEPVDPRAWELVKHYRGRFCIAENLRSSDIPGITRAMENLAQVFPARASTAANSFQLLKALWVTRVPIPGKAGGNLRQRKYWAQGLFELCWDLGG